MFNQTVALKIAYAKIARLEPQLYALQTESAMKPSRPVLSPALAAHAGRRLFASAVADRLVDGMVSRVAIFDELGQVLISRDVRLLNSHHWWVRQKPATHAVRLSGSIRSLCRSLGLVLFTDGIRSCGCNSYQLAVNWPECNINNGFSEL